MERSIKWLALGAAVLFTAPAHCMAAGLFSHVFPSTPAKAAPDNPTAAALVTASLDKDVRQQVTG